VLLYIVDSKQCIPNMLMGENPMESDEKRHPSSLMKNVNNISESIVAGVKIYRLPLLSWTAAGAILKVSSGHWACRRLQ